MLDFTLCANHAYIVSMWSGKTLNEVIRYGLGDYAIERTIAKLAKVSSLFMLVYECSLCQYYLMLRQAGVLLVTADSWRFCHVYIYHQTWLKIGMIDVNSNYRSRLHLWFPWYDPDVII